MRREALYLSDIIEAAESIAGFVSGITRESFLQSDLVRSGVLHKLTIIGEAAARLQTISGRGTLRSNGLTSSASGTSRSMPTFQSTGRSCGWQRRSRRSS